MAVSVRRLDTLVLRRRAARLEEQLAERTEALRRSLSVEQEERIRRVEVADRWAELLGRVDRLEASQRWSELAERLERIEASQRSEVVERLERLEASQRSEVVDRLQRLETSQRSEVVDRLERIEASQRWSEIVDRLQRLEASERGSEIVERLERLEASQQSEVVDRLERLEARLLGQIEELQGTVYDLQETATDPAAGGDSEYRKLVRRIKEVVRERVPAGATVLVVSRGDDNLLALYGRRGWHFPRTDEGHWGGYHPKSSLPAIAQVEALRASGADYLLLPAPSLWWLDHYSALRAHLDNHYRPLVWKDDLCVIFALHEQLDTEAVRRREVREVMAEFRSRFGRDPAVLDWHTGLELARAFPEHSVFAPPVEGNGLPYLDGSVDLVALAGLDAPHLAEAERVAAAGVIAFPRDAVNGAEGEVRWKLEGSASQLPTVSIVIPCYDGLAYTKACLTTLLETLPRSFRGEIIVVDDASSDGTGEWLDGLALEDDRVAVLAERFESRLSRIVQSRRRGRDGRDPALPEQRHGPAARMVAASPRRLLRDGST